jgi:putative sigma-54 modulation protein
VKRSHGLPGQVNVRVKAKNITLAPALREQVVAKMQRLDRYLDRLQEIEVELSTESTREAGRHNRVDATAHVLGRTIRVTATDSEMHAAIDEAVDKLYRQLNRKKERVKTHHGMKLSEALPTDSFAHLAASESEPGLNGDEPMIRIERLDMKPEFEEEAIERLETEGYAFYVFLNARDEKVNVLYRLPDGGYGLIQPMIS